MISLEVWVKSIDHRLVYMNTWSPGDSTIQIVYGGAAALLEEVCSWEQAMSIYSLTWLHVHSLCFLLAFKIGSVQLLAPTMDLSLAVTMDTFF